LHPSHVPVIEIRVFKNVNPVFAAMPYFFVIGMAE
jgi:hypothetical protein